MKTVNLQKILESKTLDEIEKELAEIIELKLDLQVFSFIDCRCFECRLTWQFDDTIEDAPEIKTIMCPQCFSDNVTWYRQTYKV